MPESRYLLVDAESGETVGMHIVESGLASEPDDIAQAIGLGVDRKIKVQLLTGEAMTTNDAHKMGQPGAGLRAAGGGGARGGGADIEQVPRRYERQSR